MADSAKGLTDGVQSQASNATGGATDRAQGAASGATSTVQGITDGALGKIQSLGGSAMSWAQGLVDRFFPPEQRAAFLAKLKSFMLANPKLSVCFNLRRTNAN